MVKISDFFFAEYGQGKYESKRDLKTKKNGTPLISSKGTEQGIYGYYDLEPKYRHVISVPRTGTICHAFYQGQSCCIDSNCLVLIPKKKLSLNEMFYFVFLIRKQKFRFLYGRQVTPERINSIEIPDKIPDWVKNTKNVRYDEIARPLEKKKIKLSDAKWAFFTYNDIFKIKKGKRLVISKTPGIGDCPFVSSVDKNNGISHWVDIKPNHQGNTITISYNGSTGEAFYQPKPFWATDDVNVLYPNNESYPEFELNPYISFFLIRMIKKEGYRFNYYRKWNMDRMNETKIFLPIDKNEDPNWQFMEDYIKSLPYSKAMET